MLLSHTLAFDLRGMAARKGVNFPRQHEAAKSENLKCKSKNEMSGFVRGFREIPDLYWYFINFTRLRQMSEKMNSIDLKPCRK